MAAPPCLRRGGASPLFPPPCGRFSLPPRPPGAPGGGGPLAPPPPSAARRPPHSARPPAAAARPPRRAARRRGSDRHLDVRFERQFDQRRRRERTFGEAGRGARLRGRLALPERDAEREIARLRARAGEDEIAQTGETRQGLRPCPQGASE